MYTILIIIAILLSLLLAILLLNKLLKRTNWWRNIFVYTGQFHSIGKYDIVNVGSNPARFAFFYESVNGQNWSTGTQGLYMDLLILKEKKQLLKDGAIVLLPIVPFSSVSGYLNSTKNLSYLCKFATIVNSQYTDSIYPWKKVRCFLQFPLLYHPKDAIFLLRDVKCDNRLEISEQNMQHCELNQDSLRWIKIWKDEFKIKKLDGELPKHLEEGRNKSVKMMCEMISFLNNQGFRPILLSPPMSAALTQYFTKEILDTYIYSFVDAVQKTCQIPYLDYMNSEFVDDKFYFNALFMNLRGRKLFTKRVLNDIGMLKM